MFPAESNIIVVDDSSAVRSLVKEQLGGLGFKNIIEAENGKAALERMEAADKQGIGFDLVISDWNMPEMNGIDFLLSLKKHAKFMTIPFLMITSESETENVIKAIVLGVTDFIVKPFDEGDLSEKLVSIWKRTHEEV